MGIGIHNSDHSPSASAALRYAAQWRSERPAEAMAPVLAVSCCGSLVCAPPEPIAERDRQLDGRRAKSRLDGDLVLGLAS
jgi:hypothetical protein